jgi:hypothetical protein
MNKTLAIVFVLLCGMVASANGDSPATGPSNTVKAHRLVHLDPAVGYDNLFTWVQSARIDLPFCSVEPQIATGLVNFSIDVDVTSNSLRRDAAELANRAIEDLRSQLAAFTQQQRDQWKMQLAPLEQQDRVAKVAYEKAKAELQVATDMLSDVMGALGLADASEDGLRELARGLETQYETAQIDTDGKAARQQALAQAIANLSSQVNSKLNSDPIVQQLQEVVDIQQKELDLLKSASANGAAGINDINKAEVAVAQAKAAVLERKEAAAQTAGADTLEAWNRDLLSLSIDLAELRARSEATEKRLADLKKVLALAKRVDPHGAIQNAVDTASTPIQVLEQQIQSLQATLADKNVPTLTVVESHDEPAGK